MSETIVEPLTSGGVEQAETFIRAALMALGYDTEARKGTVHTPYRIAKYWDSLVRNNGTVEYTENKVYCPDDEVKLVRYKAPAHSQLVMVRDLDFISACEHHFLPVLGKCAVGYIPGEHIIGLSKFARILRKVALRPTTQEYVTEVFGMELMHLLRPRFLGVQITATHTCMSCRGAEQIDSSTTTSFFRPSDQDTTKQEFFWNLRR